MNVELNNEQIYALYDLEHWWHSADSKQTFEITGPGGSGKSFIVSALIERLGLKNENVLYMTYMGKAAMVLARHGLPAKTIHATIYDYVERPVRDEDGKFVRYSNGKVKLKGSFELKDHISKKIKLLVIDECSMVPEKMAEDILSFGIPIIVLGDLNQLPPVFGDSYFLKKPDVVLTKIMRQAEGDPIIWLSQEVLAGRDLKYGVYGNSSVIRKSDLTDFHFRTADMIGTGTNRLRYNINNYCRETIKGIRNLEYPHIGEKVICRKNNWGRQIDDGIFMVNGMTGFVDNIYRDSYNGKTMKMDFRPDFTKKIFKNIEFDYKHMYSIPGNEENEVQNKFSYLYDKFEYSYANTIYALQGSEFPFFLYLHEDYMRDKEDRKRLMYTAISRARKSVTVVL